MRLANKNAIYSVSLKLNTDLISNSNGNPHYIAHLSLVKECLKASQFFWTGGVWLVSANENFFTFYSQNKKLGIRICKNLIEERSKTKTKKKEMENTYHECTIKMRKRTEKKILKINCHNLKKNLQCYIYQNHDCCKMTSMH